MDIELDEKALNEAKTEEVAATMSTDAERTEADNTDSTVTADIEEDKLYDIPIYAEDESFFGKMKRKYPWLYRALRTFLQTFVSVMCGQITMLGMDDFSKKALFGITTSAGAAALSAVMNMNEGSPTNG